MSQTGMRRFFFGPERAASKSIFQAEEVKEGMARGTVKWFNESKGFGFIAQEDGTDVFVHFSAIQGEGFRTLAEGEPVEFDVERDEKGLRAVRVRRSVD